MEICGVVCRQSPCFNAVAAPAKHKSMDVCGVVDRKIAYFSRSEIFDLGDRRNHKVSFKSGRLGFRMVSGFNDEGHLRYYNDVPRCGMKKDREKIRRDLKLLEGFSKDLSPISQIGFGLDPVDGMAIRFPTKPDIEIDEILEKLSQMRAENKDMKKKRKQEKAKEKASCAQNMLDSESSSSSSSSSSSDSECDQVIDMSSRRTEGRLQPVPQELQASHTDKKLVSTLVIPTTQQETIAKNCTQSYIPQNYDQDCLTGHHPASGVSAKRIEVCTGKACTKSGAASLLKEFERVLGPEGTVSGCKCMGKCKNGPNVRISDCNKGVSQLGSDSVRSPTNTSFVSVGLADVSVIVANMFSDGKTDSGFR